MTNILCKFRLSSMSRHDQGNGVILATVDFQPVYPKDSDLNHENRTFWKYTPSGKIELGMVNDAAVQSLDLGKEYYVIITDVRPAGLGGAIVHD